MSQDVTDAVRRHVIEAVGGPPPGEASVTFLGLEPISILRFGPDAARTVRYVTVGCSRHPMGDPTDMIADPLKGPRAELVMTVVDAVPEVETVRRTLAVLAASPAVEGLVLAPDSLLDVSEPLWDGAPFTAVLLGEDSGIDSVDAPGATEPVRFLGVVPITATEAAWVRLRGALALRDAWAEAGIDVRNPKRGAARL